MWQNPASINFSSAMDASQIRIPPLNLIAWLNFDIKGTLQRTSILFARYLFIQRKMEHWSQIFDKINIELINGSGNNSTLDEVISNLENAGFNVIKTAKTSSTSNTTIINRNNELEEVEENKIKELLKTESIVSGDSNSNVDLTIIIGKDYTN